MWCILIVCVVCAVAGCDRSGRGVDRWERAAGKYFYIRDQVGEESVELGVSCEVSGASRCVCFVPDQEVSRGSQTHAACRPRPHSRGLIDCECAFVVTLAI